LVEGMTSGLIVSQIGGLVILVGEILLVFKLENETGRNIVYLTLVLGILIAIISTILFFSALTEFMDILDNAPGANIEDELVNFQTRMNVYGLMGLVTTILLLIAYFIPYDRIKKGELKPVLLSPPILRPTMFPPPYPVPPPPPRQDTRIDPIKPKVPSPNKKMKPVEIVICSNCGSRYPKTGKSCYVCGKQ
jgi:hypothetical protein